MACSAAGETSSRATGMRLVEMRLSPSAGTIRPMRVAPSAAYTIEVDVNSSASSPSSGGSSLAHLRVEAVSNASTDSAAVASSKKSAWTIFTAAMLPSVDEPSARGRSCGPATRDGAREVAVVIELRQRRSAVERRACGLDPGSDVGDEPGEVHGRARVEERDVPLRGVAFACEDRPQDAGVVVSVASREVCQVVTLEPDVLRRQLVAAEGAA